MIVDVEADLQELMEDPPMHKATMHAVIGAKIKTAMSLGRNHTHDEGWYKSVA